VQHGKGKFFVSPSDVKEGIWENGKRLKWLEDNEI
jgi:hypothetical protein